MKHQDSPYALMYEDADDLVAHPDLSKATFALSFVAASSTAMGAFILYSAPREAIVGGSALVLGALYFGLRFAACRRPYAAILIGLGVWVALSLVQGVLATNAGRFPALASQLLFLGVLVRGAWAARDHERFRAVLAE